MKVSIIIPVFNTDIGFLNECFSSIERQSVQDFEAIVVDDGSEPEIANYLDARISQNEKFRLIHTSNRGVSAARNRGIKESSGEWLTFIDADDYIEDDTIKTVLEIAEGTSSDIVMWRFDKDYNGLRKETSYVGKNEIVFEKKGIEQIERMLLNFYKYADSMQFTFLPASPCKLYRSEIIKSNNILFYENLRNGEDAVFTLEVVHQAQKIYFRDVILYHYRQWENSASKNYRVGVIENWIQNRKELKSVLKKMNVFAEYEDDYNYHALEILKILLFTVIIKSGSRRVQVEVLKRLMSEDVFGICIDKLKFNSVFGLKGKVVLFFARKRWYHLMILMTQIRFSMTKHN